MGSLVYLCFFSSLPLLVFFLLHIFSLISYRSLPISSHHSSLFTPLLISCYKLSCPSLLYLLSFPPAFLLPKLFSSHISTTLFTCSSLTPLLIPSYLFYLSFLSSLLFLIFRASEVHKDIHSPLSSSFPLYSYISPIHIFLIAFLPFCCLLSSPSLLPPFLLLLFFSNISFPSLISYTFLSVLTSLLAFLCLFAVISSLLYFSSLLS